MPSVVEMLKAKQWLFGITVFFALFFCLAVPQSMSAPFVFLKNIEIGSIEFVNMFGLIRDLSLTILLAGLYVSMLAILSSIVNIQFNELVIVVVITTVIATIVWGVPGLFVIVFLYYCREIREFVQKMKDGDPRISCAMGVTMTFMLLGILGGAWAARSQLYFDPHSLEFTKGFGKAWLNCETNMTVDDCAEKNAEISMGYSPLLKSCEPLSGNAKESCIQKVEATKQYAYEQILSQYQRIGDVHESVGEFTMKALAQYLNTWVGLMPNESRFVLALIAFSLITTVGFVIELAVPVLTGLLMDIFIGYKIIHPYEKEEKAKYYVVLE